MRRLLRLCLLLTLSACSQAPSPYVGATRCASCHASEYKDWQGSDHWAAMAPASDASVLGDFNNAHFVYGKITSTFYRQGREFWVRTDNAQGELQAFRISDTFGVHPLQQYMVGFPDGRKQVLNIALDSRPAEQGGQRSSSAAVRRCVSATCPTSRPCRKSASCCMTNLGSCGSALFVRPRIFRRI